MKRRLVEAFNELYFRTSHTGPVLSLDCKISDLNKFSTRCSNNKDLLDLLSDLNMLLVKGDIRTPQSNTAVNIIWDRTVRGG